MSIFQFKSLQARTFSTLVPLVLITLILISFLSYFFAKQKLDTEISQNAAHSLSRVKADIAANVDRHALLVSMLTKSAEQVGTEMNIEDYGRLFEQELTLNDMTYGLGIYFAKDAYDPGVTYRSIYVHRDGELVKQSTEYDDPQYDYLTQPWYTEAVERGKDINFTEPFYDSKLKINMITAGKVFYDREGKLLGVITGDLNMTNIQTYIEKMKFGTQGSAILMDMNGAILSSGLPSLKSGESLTKTINAEAAQAIQKGTSGQVSVAIDQENYRVMYEALPQTGWKIGVLLPESDLNRSANEMLKLLLIVSVIGILLIMGALLINNSGMIKEIKKIRQMTNRMALGDYTVELPHHRKDEFGQMADGINKVIVATRGMALRLSEESDVISGVSSKISQEISGATKDAQHNAGELAQVKEGAELQLTAAAESATAMEEMAVGIQRIAESIQHVSEATTEIEHKAQQGNERLNVVSQGMHKAKMSMDEAGRVVSSLNERSAQIGSIIGMIQEISGQTKLLSLNASIEAARAGEHGQGFAVVASEIGKLAVNVSESAEQITSRIRTMQEETKLALEGMQQGTLEMDEGVSILREVEERFIAMNQDIQQVAIEVQEVSSASEEMSAGSEEVAASIGYLADIAKASAVRAGQASERSERQLEDLEGLDSSAKSLTGVSDTLNQVVSRFRV
ncbi:methyl-accepting chemotaxis protein [Paenibacillus sp. EKM202P]|uniref:methyl-accepting chemotaxis protein n=1 Tax=unclassified Paenibacillus TaxID=185978 RepID=UPI0013E9D258|nr:MULTISPECIES: methyl-accepting chemotaxis protein [unclassified Paenibacillus]KAF6562227.1 methyl-accepting chemotaxis protein [Paenibacillus sp. EKM202P]KAF6567156.1 methyl-accepting chemotaxis protein [Paenibacillus sp. EKM207P]